MLIAFFLWSFIAHANAPLRTEFRIPESGVLKKRADFWVKIYSQYSTKQGVLHDTRYSDIIYEEYDAETAKSRKATWIKNAKDRYRKILSDLHTYGVEHDAEQLKKLSLDHKRVFELFKEVQDPNKFLSASHYKRIRFQLGQKDQFLQGIKDSGAYLPFMEEVFAKKGLPVELTRLPFVESSFNVKARSKVGASGIWQFMQSTAKHFITVNDAIDERNDPMRASEAAAELLSVNYQSLNEWPLAVTAYNHGRKSLMLAVRRLGTYNLEEIILKNKARTFGFASSNFFACLIAALEVEKNRDKFWGTVDRSVPHRFFEVALPAGIKLKDLVSFLKLNRKELIDFNPAFTSETLKSQLYIPAKYRLRLPLKGDGTPLGVLSEQRVFLAGFNKIPKTFKVATEDKKHE